MALSKSTCYWIRGLSLILFEVHFYSVEVSAVRTWRFSTYTYRDHNLLLPFEPQRLIESGFPGVLKKSYCAILSIETNSPFGFLYNQMSGLCTPVTGMATYGNNGARAVESYEGGLYTKCPAGYQLNGTDDAIYCLKVSLEPATYNDADDRCISWGHGHLAKVDTVDKLNFLKNISYGELLWIGLDDQDSEDVFVWRADGSSMTTEERNSLFNPDEPNNQNDVEHCAQTSFKFEGLLNDWKCFELSAFACEVLLT